MDTYKIIETTPVMTLAAEQRARERIRLWFEEHDRPFSIAKRTRRGKTLILLAAILCAGAFFGNHTPVTQALSNIHSVLGV